METITAQTVLVSETCLTCGIQFAIPSEYVRQLKDSHRAFYCPSGHNMFYPAQTQEEQLRKQLRKSEETLAEARQANLRVSKQLDGALGRLSKARKRANAGLCPHCKRHFVNVERHVKTKHADQLK